MVKKKYSGEKEIKDKIDALFSYRKLTDLLIKGQLDKNRIFVGHLNDIQYQIYLLDAFLEGQWALDKEKQHSHWVAISEALSKLHYTADQIASLLSEIRKYERIELNCRKDKWPTRVSFKRFYTTKSCDVRLIRHLIYDTRPDLKAIWKEDSWVYYDLITEINDDITDLHEDLHSYNGNRFLISILRKGSKKTAKQYLAYLLKITAKAKAYFKKNSGKGENTQLYTWTIERAHETIDLMEKRIGLIEPDSYSSSLLLEKMK